MADIAGGIGIRVGNEVSREMLASMAHYEPCKQGIFADEDVCLLYSAETDSCALQMCLNGESYTILFDGVLYNAQEVRALLVSLGHKFTGTTDAELLIHAYAQWYEGCLDRLNGIFALAIWEKKRKKLFLSRDRIGVKPMFYTLRDNGILFGSEIKLLLKHPDVQPILDGKGAVQLLMFGPGRIPGSGVLRDIRELEPGCFGYFHCGKWTWKRYWKLTDREHTEGFQETAEHVRYLLTDAIGRQSVSDTPIGTFLSGGLDSSLVSSVVASALAEKGEKLHTFSLDFSGNDAYFVPGKFQPSSDGVYIQIMTEYLESEHHLTVLTPADQLRVLEAATQARDLPGMADVDFSLYAFCAEIRKHVAVALSGECSDEIFGGYPWYRDPEIRDREGFPWARNTRERSTYLDARFLKQIDPYAFVDEQYQRTVREADILPGTQPLERRMKQMANLNHRWFMQTLLDRNDRMSRHNSLEVRVPFCDYRIAEYLYGVPWEFKDYNDQEKGLLRYAMREYLPERICNRKKSPYPKTYDPNYLALVTGRMRMIMDRKDAPIWGIVRQDAVEHLMDNELSQPWYGQLMQRPQTIAHMLQINYWLEHYKVRIIE